MTIKSLFFCLFLYVCLAWVGAAYFWFFAATLAAARNFQGSAWQWFAWFNGIVGVVTMIVAVILTIYSLWLYFARYGRVLTG